MQQRACIERECVCGVCCYAVLKFDNQSITNQLCHITHRAMRAMAFRTKEPKNQRTKEAKKI